MAYNSHRTPPHLLVTFEAHPRPAQSQQPITNARAKYRRPPRTHPLRKHPARKQSHTIHLAPGANTARSLLYFATVKRHTTIAEAMGEKAELLNSCTLTYKPVSTTESSTWGFCTPGATRHAHTRLIWGHHWPRGRHARSVVGSPQADKNEFKKNMTEQCVSSLRVSAYRARLRHPALASGAHACTPRKERTDPSTFKV